MAIFRTLQAGIVAVLATALLLTGCADRIPAAPQESAATAAPSPTPTPAPKPRVPLTSTLFGWTSVFSKIFPKKTKPPEAVPPQLLGEIRQVNAENQFVLIDASISTAAQPGDELICLANQQQTATLKLTSLRSASFLIADITEGTPSVGDRVYRK